MKKSLIVAAAFAALTFGAANVATAGVAGAASLASVRMPTLSHGSGRLPLSALV